MSFTSGKADPILGSTNADLDRRVKVLEAWRIALTGTVTAIANAGTALAVRVKKLEDAPAAGGEPLFVAWKPVGDASLTSLAGRITQLVARMDAIEAKTCPNESRIVALEQDHIPDPPA